MQLPSGPRALRLAVVAGLLAWATVAGLMWTRGGPLGDNEALYARAAEQELDGVRTRWTYLSRGMIVVAAPGVIAGGSEHALRVVPVLFGFAFVLASMLAARRLVGTPVAAAIAGVLAASWSIASRSAELLSDLPSATMLLLGMTLLLGELGREGGPRRRLIGVAPLFAAAFYLRYGSCLAISIIGIVALAVGWRGVARRPAIAAVTALVFAALMAPHFIDANAVTGTPLGILRDSKDYVPSPPLGTGLVQYVTANPFSYYGLITAPLLVLGLLSIIRPRDRRAVALWLIAVADVLALGMTTVAESRYIVFSTVLLVMLGIDVAQRWLAARPGALATALRGLAIAAIAASWFVVVVRASHAIDKRTRFDATVAGAETVRHDAPARCQVVARNFHQVEWYSKCESNMGEEPGPPGQVVYVLRDTNGDYQPILGEYAGRAHVLLERPDISVVRMDR